MDRFRGLTPALSVTVVAAAGPVMGGLAIALGVLIIRVSRTGREFVDIVDN